MVKVIDLSEAPHVERELLMIKVRATGKDREEMKRLADGGEMNFDGYLDKMSHLVNEGTLDPDILSKMRDAAPQLISFAKSFDPTSKEEIKILTDTSKLIYDLFGVKSEK